MLKKNLWIVALIAALAMIFVGCGGGESTIVDDRPLATEDLTIDVAADIGALLSRYSFYNKRPANDDETQVAVAVNKATFNFTADDAVQLGPDGLGFMIDFPQKAKDELFKTMIVTYKLDTITTGKAKIGHKFSGEAGGTGDLTPYPDYEIYFAATATADTTAGYTATQEASVYSLSKNALFFGHNVYHSNVSGNPSTAAPVNYTLEITKIEFIAFEEGELPPIDPPVIETQPQTRAIANDAASVDPLTVIVDTAAADVTRTYQWEKEVEGEFTDVTGATTASLNLATTLEKEGTTYKLGTYKFRLVITNTRGDEVKAVTSAVASIIVYDPATIISTIPALAVGATGIDFTDLGTGLILIPHFNATTGIKVAGRNGSENDMILSASDDGLLVSGRSANYDGVEIDLAALSLTAGKTYTVTVAGTWTPATSEPTIGLVYASSPLDTGNPNNGPNMAAGSFATGTAGTASPFTVSVDLLGNVAATRVMTRSWGDNKTTDYIITSIKVVEVIAAPVITTTALPMGFANEAYPSTTLTATGATPMTWTLDTGSNLPTGLTLSDAGVISGTPTAVGSSTFTVKATNATDSDTKSLTIAVYAKGTAGLVFSMNTNTDVQALDAGEVEDDDIAPWLATSGDATFTATKAADDIGGLADDDIYFAITSRTASHDTIDILVSANIASLKGGLRHTIVVTGNADKDATNALLFFEKFPGWSPMSGATVVIDDETGDFTLTRTFTWAELTGLDSIRIKYNTADDADLDIYNIVITGIAD